MGRENISLQIDVKKQYVSEFIREWNQFLTENNESLDEDNLLEEEFFEPNGIDPETVSYEGDEIANLFDWPNDTGLMDFCKAVATKYPDIEFNIEYELSWDNCADTLIEGYSVTNHKLRYDIMSGEYFCGEDNYEEREEELEELKEDAPGLVVELIDEAYYIVSSHTYGEEFV